MSQIDQQAIERVLGNKFYKYMPGLAIALRSVNAAVLVSYLLYWQGKGLKKKYVYKSINDMRLETGLSRYQQKSAIKRCSELGILKVEVKGIPATRHFRLDIQGVIEHLSSCGVIGKLVERDVASTLAENQQTITESNTEKSKIIFAIYRGYLRFFELKTEDCRLTAARQLLIADRLDDAGLELVKRAIVAASKSDYYRGFDDGQFKGTIENIFKSYEQIENLANMEYDPYKQRD